MLVRREIREIDVLECNPRWDRETGEHLEDKNGEYIWDVVVFEEKIHEKYKRRFSYFLKYKSNIELDPGITKVVFHAYKFPNRENKKLNNKEYFKIIDFAD